MPKPFALVTGASSGIGRELARVLAREGYDLAIVARRTSRLRQLADELRQRYGTETICLTYDLLDKGSPQGILRDLETAGHLDIDVLVNDAGFGKYGNFAPMAWEDIAGQVKVNVLALLRLTRLVLPGMLQRRRGRILNVASLAGNLPGPGMAIYYATKAFVLSFSEALSEETQGTGVTITALSPGLTHTEFHQVAGQHGARWGWMDADRVAEIGYRSMVRGRRVVNAGWWNALAAFVIRFVPHGVLLRSVRRMR